MIIRLTPAYPHPNILYNLNLPDPTNPPPISPSWHMQKDTIEMLQDEGFMVDLPRDVHALDKAVWHTGLLSEVVFDAVELLISCTFVDGHTVSWPLPSERGPGTCLAALDAVVDTVAKSADLSCQEKMAQVNASVASSGRASGSGVQSAPVSPTSTLSNKAHKRQRSLLSSLFAAVKGALSESPNRAATLPPIKIPSSSHSRSLSHFTASPPASPTVLNSPACAQSPAFPLEVRPRAPIAPPRHGRVRAPYELLRTQARSQLVDIMRRYVLPVFSTTGSPSFLGTQCSPGGLAQMYGFPPGLYPAWACRSVLRKTEERLREMLSEANAHGAELALNHTSRALRQTCSTSTTVSRFPEDDDDDLATVSATSLSTETDGSSVHTPIDSPARSPWTPALASPRTSVPCLAALDMKAPSSSQVPRSPSPPSPEFDFDMNTYHTLRTLRAHLQAVLHKMASTPHQIATGPAYDSNLTILEVKSRRRAWSARDYVGGARMNLVGLATVFRPSPLARCEPVTAETLARWEALPSPPLMVRSPTTALRPSLAVAPEVFAEFGVSVGVRAVTKDLDAQLFPVSEEEEGDSDEEDRHGLGAGYGSGLDEYDDEEWRHVEDFDLESGLSVHAFPRRAEPAALPVPSSPTDAFAPPPSPHLHHPMVRSRTQSMRVERPGATPLQQPRPTLSPNALLCQPLKQLPVHVPVMLDESGGGVSGAEFTLGMDLPPPPRTWGGQDGAVSVSCR
ncbi:uncharacterized protein BXZ73DRAFT_45778 [Epithele typhae]|uniref:uncharacterized protein n=1 Tax=Epithele typhae TaxID=378194 RepID=UPI0020074BA6|nr:uncharacterized protein BXZ73DRAFT_45778 [Epithele typhae]KAH9934477.1 hypothetical protein BXZ73DRAFT_45778 [Epithele typhae]